MGLGQYGVHESVLPPGGPEHHPVAAEHDEHGQPKGEGGHHHGVGQAGGPDHGAHVVTAVKVDGAPAVERWRALQQTEDPGADDQIGAEVRGHTGGIGQRVNDGKVPVHRDHDDGVDPSKGEKVHEHHQGLAQSGVQGPHAWYGGRNGEGHHQHGLEQVGQQEVEDEAVGHMEELGLPLEHQQDNHIPKQRHAKNERNQRHLDRAVDGGGPGRVGPEAGGTRRPGDVGEICTHACASETGDPLRVASILAESRPQKSGGCVHLNVRPERKPVWVLCFAFLAAVSCRVYSHFSTDPTPLLLGVPLLLLTDQRGKSASMSHYTHVQLAILSVICGATVQSLV